MHTSLWRATADLPSFPTLKQNIKTEVLIIGGGIAGLLTAYRLHRAKIPYVLLEKECICGGTTQNTTAKITLQHGLIYRKLLSLGVEQAQKYLLANQRALDEYKTLCRDIDCDFEEQDNVVYSLGDKGALEAEARALERLGASASYREKLPLPLRTVGGVCVPKQGQFHPLKFLSAISSELSVFEHSFVRSIEGNKAITDRGSVSANHIVVTTHFPFINTHGAYFLKLYQHRSYVIALEGAEQVGSMYVDEAQGGLSFRNHGDLLLLGGGAHRTGKQGGAWQELQQFSAVRYPNATERYHWAAQDCMSLDGLPYIGQYSNHKAEFSVASGFCKWGMTGAMVASMLLCDRIVGKRNDVASVFDPSRSIWSSQLLINGAETVKNLLTPTVPRCPHLGCALKWNATEHSWDCACHGSRFDADGKVLDNPANGNLKK